MKTGLFSYRWARSLAIILGLCGMAGPAMAEKGLGPYYNEQYRSNGIVETKTLYSSYGSVEVALESITTINCSGCDVSYYSGGMILHLRNPNDRAMCVTVEITPRDSSNQQWGNGAVYYLKPKQRARQAAGVYDLAGEGKDEGSVNVGFTYSVNSSAPLAKNRCR